MKKARFKQVMWANKRGGETVRDVFYFDGKRVSRSEYYRHFGRIEEEEFQGIMPNWMIEYDNRVDPSMPYVGPL